MTYDNLKKWTLPDNYFGAAWPEYYSAGVGQSRESDALERSNFATMLRELGGESETVLIIREGHWAVGWVEWIAIHESDGKALARANDLCGALADYPVLDDDDFSERECEEAAQIWAQCYSVSERIEYIRRYRSQFEFRDMRDMLGCVRGKYFAGYASELLT